MSLFDELRGASCVRAAEALGIAMKRKNGGVAWALCPMHGERGHASLFLSDNRGWYCYGCHRGGDAVRLYQEMLGLDALSAARQCARDLGYPCDESYDSGEVRVTARHLIDAVEAKRREWARSLAESVCDADDEIQKMIHANGAETCAEDPAFSARIEARARLQTRLDELVDADGEDLIALLRTLDREKDGANGLQRSK